LAGGVASEVGGKDTAHGGAEIEAVGSICKVRQVYASARRKHSGLRSSATVQVGTDSC
jgi:hypothetical protein